MNYTNKKTPGCGPSGCPKSGIKIHETPTANYNSNTNYNANYNTNSNTNSNTNYNSNYNNNNIMLKKSSVQAPISFHQTTLSELDLNVDNYSLEDLYNLFNIPGGILNETNLKSAKQIVYKMHPDKCRLDQKYFLFFSKAYKCLFSIYEFQNKSDKKTEASLKNDFYEDSNAALLNNMFETRKELKNPKNFNNWFNEKFEKHKLEDDDTNKGYGDWLKSDEGLYSQQDNVTQNNMNEAFERQKKQIQALTTYNGVGESFASFSGGGSLLGDLQDNFSGAGYTDLRQAHIETIIPVTQDDYDKMPKYKNMNEYKSQRDRVDVTPLTKEQSESILLKTKNNLDHESAAMAYKYAKQLEKSKENQRSFWGDIKQLL
jgi:hypothetical protein